MDRHYQLKVTSPTTNIDVNSIDSEEVARIVQLAGIEAKKQTIPQQSVILPQPVSMPPPVTTVDSDIADDHTTNMDDIDYQDQSMIDDQIDGVIEEIADYDRGNAPDIEEVDTDTYIWEPDHLEQRFGKMGDNTLKPIDVEESSGEIYENLIKSYKQYVAEAERENDDGIMSPLSDPTKPEFDKDPFAGDTPVDDGSQSPMSQIKRQPALK